MRVTKLRQKEASGAFGQPVPIGTDAQYITVTTVEGDEEFTLDQVIISTNETINDLYAEVEAEIAAAIIELNAAITALSESTDASFAEVNATILALTQDTNAEIAEINASITALTNSTNESFSEVNASITALTNSTNESFSEVNASITALTNSTDEQFSDIASQIASINTSIINIESGGAVTKLGTDTVGSASLPIYLDAGSPKVITGAIATTYGGTGNTSGRATYVNVTTTNPTSATTYYIPFTTGISSGSNYSLDGNNGLRYNTLEGTTSDVGYSILYLGNSTASGTAGNKNGRIRIYGSGENYWTLSGNKSTSSNYTLYLPLGGGCLVAATNGSAVGSATNPIYINSSGVATACNAMVPVAGTTMTGQLIGYASTNYTTAQFRNIILATSLPSSADNGTVCLIYE